MSGREGEDNWIYSESSTTPERGIDQSRSVVLLCSSENVFFSKLVVVFHPLHLFLKKEKQEEKKLYKMIDNITTLFQLIILFKKNSKPYFFNYRFVHFGAKAHTS